MNKVVYIAGMGYSGSTILDLLLGSHSRMIGLGEIQLLIGQRYQLLFQDELPYCACSKRMSECDFWKKLVHPLSEMSSESEAARYKLVVDSFHAHTGSVLVDSSKHLNGLENLLKVDGIDLKILFLIKDVRAFAASNAKHFQRINFNSESTPSLRKRLINEAAFPHWGFIRWHRANRRIKAYLDTKRLDYFQFGYEELCLRPEEILPEICNFVGVEYEAEMLDLTRSTSHTILGNGMLLDKDRKSQLRYDNRWFLDQRLMRAAAIFPNIMKFNAQQVYKNIT